jgi:hypothetical protein
MRERDAARDQAAALARDLQTARRELTGAARQLAGLRGGPESDARDDAAPAEQGDGDATQVLDAQRRSDGGAPEPEPSAREAADAPQPGDAATEPVPPPRAKPRRKVVITDAAVAGRTPPTLTHSGPSTAAPGHRQVSARIVAAIALLLFAVVVVLILLTTL